MFPFENSYVIKQKNNNLYYLASTLDLASLLKCAGFANRKRSLKES